MAKGLKALMEEKAEENARKHREASYGDDFDVGRQHLKLPVDSIVPNPYQPRLAISDESIKEFALSIGSAGLLQPITVRLISPGKHEIIAGERRWRAHKLLNKPTIEALVISATDEQSATYALLENMERDDLTDFEIGTAILKLQAMFGDRKKLAAVFNIQRSDLYRYLAFDRLPSLIKERLSLHPSLLSRSAAEEIVRALKSGEGAEAERLERLNVAWEKLEQGKIDQTKIAQFVARGIPQPMEVNALSLRKEGKKVGAFACDGKHVKVKIAMTALKDGQLQKLQSFVTELLE